MREHRDKKKERLLIKCIHTPLREELKLVEQKGDEVTIFEMRKGARVRLTFQEIHT